MVDTSKSSPFVTATLLPAIRDDRAIAQLNERRLNAFRQWRPSPSNLSIARPYDADPYLFVLLADQEFGEQRPEQAESLIEAAYLAYDQWRFGS
jgi:hypothetical protein